MKHMNLRRFGRRLSVAVGASAVAIPAFADTTTVDTTAIVAILVGGLAAVAAVGAAKLGLAGLTVLYQKVSGAVSRT